MLLIILFCKICFTCYFGCIYLTYLTFKEIFKILFLSLETVTLKYHAYLEAMCALNKSKQLTVL